MPTTPSPPPALPAGARCGNHPERDASQACARCGAFVCPSCLVGDDLCAGCKRRLLKEGVPWTSEEKARAAARDLRGRTELGLRVEMGVAVVGLLISAGVSSTFLPGFLAKLGLGVWGLACVIGVLVAGCALRGYQLSERGRPGPAVGGVFTRGHAALIVGLALLPVLISVGDKLFG